MYLMIDNIPLLMVIAFLLLTLLVGIYCRGQATSLREYAIGDKQLPTVTLVATMLATTFNGAGLLRNVEEAYLQGLIWVGCVLSIPLGYWILSPLMLRMKPFMDHLSLVETIGYSYGSVARIFMALVWIVCYILGLASQIIALSTVIKMCTGIANPRFITIAAICVLIVYASLAGMRSVTFTDILQFVVFSLTIPLLAIWLWHQTKQSIMPCIQYYPQLHGLLHWDKKYWAMIALFLANLASFIQPTTIQRVYMAEGPIQAKKLFLYSGIFSFIIKACITLITLFLFLKNPLLSKEAIWPNIIMDLSDLCKGLISISLLVMIMATVDAQLNTCAVIVSHDLIEGIRKLTLSPSHPLFISISAPFKRILLKVTDAIPALQLARWATILIGAIAMLVAAWYKALLHKDLLELLVLMLNFSVPITVAPYILALYGFRGSTHTALIGMTTGIASIWIWNKWIKPQIGIDGSFLCMLANGLAMLTAHYFLPQPAESGWVSSDNNRYNRAKGRVY